MSPPVPFGLVPGRRVVYPAAVGHRGDHLGVEVLPRVAVEDDEIRGLAGDEAAAAAFVPREPCGRDGCGVERLLDGQRLLWMPGRTVVDRAAYAGADARKRIELLDRRIAAVRDDRARVEQRA